MRSCDDSASESVNDEEDDANVSDFVDGLPGLPFCREVLRRKSWVTAMPIEAKEREVRSQARKVRSALN